MSETIGEILKNNEELLARFKKILENHNCTKEYICLEKTYADLCQVCPLGSTPLLECVNPNHNSCKYLYSIGDRSFCECEVRIFIQNSIG